ncbi:MAG: ribbon-helix-helix domain-containing protein [Rhodomicrobium sp.]
MNEKSKTLLEQLQAVSGKTATPPGGIPATNYDLPPSRRGKKAVTIWVDPLVAEQLKEIAFHHKKPQQDLFLEALNILFAKYGRPEIA